MDLVHDRGSMDPVHKSQWSMDPVQSGSLWTPGPCFVLTPYRTTNITLVACLFWFMAYRTRNITFVACLLWFMAYRTRNVTFEARLL